MRDENYRAAEGRQRVEQYVFGAHVEVLVGSSSSRKFDGETRIRASA